MDSTGWKIYFWIIVTLTGLGTLFLLSSQPTLMPRDILQLGGEILGLIGLYTYVYKKETFPALFWKYFFWIWIVIDTIGAFIYTYTEAKTIPALQILYKQSEYFENQNNIFMTIFGIIIYLPYLYALYRLAYPSKTKKRKK